MTKTWARRTVQAGALAAGFLLVTGGVANAGTDVVSAGNNGIANGNQVVAPIQVPINVCGNAIAVLGVAGAGCDGGADANLESGSLGDMVSAGNQGILNGTQVQAPIQVPIDVCGNAVGALIGVAGAGCDGGSDANIGRHHHESKVLESGSDMVSAGNNGIGNGNQLQIPIQVPINICGNAIAVLGVAGAGCDGGSAANLESGSLGDMVSAGNQGILNGNQVQAPIQVPINICGNAIAVLGAAGAGCDGGSSANIGRHHHRHGESAQVPELLPTGGLDGLPVNQALNTLPGGDTVAGLANGLPTAGLTDGLVSATNNGAIPAQAQDVMPPRESGVTEGKSGDMVSAGNNGILNGTQLQLPIQIPIDISGNAIAILGVAGAGSGGGSAANMS